MPANGTGIRRRYADTRFGQVHLRAVEGPGIPVVLLHRTPASSASFEAVLQRLAGRRAALALDTPGFGASFLPAEAPDTAAYARYFLAALDALGIGEVHICAHHSGTHFAVEMAAAAGPRVRSLLLSGVMHATAGERAAMRAAIGRAAVIEPSGAYLATTWSTLRPLYAGIAPEILHADLLGALLAIEGRDQCFDAILQQDFAAVLATLRCPLAIVQPVDDPLAPLLDRVRAAHPAIPVTIAAAAGLAMPEMQPDAYADALLAFAAAHDDPHQETPA